jgi:NAD(P)-dependent dehydrogenase (short-subunit alcohol dehydrogenase family)
MSDILKRLFSLEGRVAIVTGGSRGIGAAIAAGLAGAGAKVTAVGRTKQVEMPSVQYRSCDMSAEGEFEKLVGEQKQLHILVNAAAITLPPAPGAEVERYDRTMEVNLRAAFRACVAAAEVMKRSGGGSIINVTSINSELGFPANPAYVAAKGGLRALTKALALDLAPSNIRVNALAPGYIRTAMTAASHADPAARAARLARMMLQRFGEPDDVVGAAIFLASPASSYVTGADLFVDGGWTARGL